MAWPVLALIIAVPIAEIAAFVAVAGKIGILQAVLLAILAGMAGLWMLRRQGLATLARARAQADRGELPIGEAFDGVCLVLAGGLLLVPGFLSDILALALLIPPVRAALRGWLSRHMTVVQSSGPTGPVILEGEFEEVRPRPGEPPPGPQGSRPPLIEGEIIEPDRRDRP